MANLAEMAGIVRRWFAAAHVGDGPILPDGWFGRPHDNQYSLEGVESEGETLVVRLSQETTLIIDQPGRVYVDESELVFENYRVATLRWISYGGTDSREERYFYGQVRFVPPVGTSVD
jgi:hypothetical protein